jgi:predicted transglutaminase-like cysteine proteinase
MLRMAMFHPLWRANCSWRHRLTAISWAAAVAAVMAMPSQLMAQSTDHSANTLQLQRCVRQPSASPVGMEILRLNNLEPSSGPRPESEAANITGGKISKLEQMRLAQGAASSNLGGAGSDMLPSSPDGFRDHCDEANDLQIRPLANPADAILGSMSITIAHTPFDLNWASVSAKRDRGKIDQLLTATGARHSNSQAAQIEAVNRWVNRHIEFGEDRDVYGRADYWAPASETFRRGVGDCEDFAIAKMELLSALGIGRDKMRLVVARDLVRNADHAVLVVTMSDGPVMLDNMTDRLLDARRPNDYRPIMSFSQNVKWVHGDAAQQVQPERMALANAFPQPTENQMAEVLTVTIEPQMPILSMALLSVPLVLPSGLPARA